MAMRFVIIDLETTGNGPKKGDRIIQLGMAVVEGRSIVARFASFFNPEQPIPPFIQQLTNIDEQTVEEAPLFADKAGEIAAMMKGAYFVAHNVDFDLPFCRRSSSGPGVRRLPVRRSIRWNLRASCCRRRKATSLAIWRNSSAFAMIARTRRTAMRK